MQLQDVSYDLIPRCTPLLLTRTPAGFPSPAQDDMEEPIHLVAYLVEHPAAGYIIRVDGHSMAGAGINAKVDRVRRIKSSNEPDCDGRAVDERRQAKRIA